MPKSEKNRDVPIVRPPKRAPISFVAPILTVVCLILAGTTIWFYRQYQVLKNNPQFLSQAANKRLVQEVGRLMILPAEEPTIATVTDPDKLKSQAFFAQAKTGDKVLIFAAAKKAVLYDPTARLIVDIAPVNVGGDSAPVSQSGPSANESAAPSTAAAANAAPSLPVSR